VRLKRVPREIITACRNSGLSGLIGIGAAAFAGWIAAKPIRRSTIAYRLWLFAAPCGASDVFLVKDQNRSPQITHISWARLKVEGKAEPYKDAKLFPGGSREWNWRETGTQHVPGIQPADVRELLDYAAKVVVLSRGMAECRRVPRETRQLGGL
jgi:hypothetical protein